MYQPIAITTNIEVPQTQLILTNTNLRNQNKLVAVWRLDEHSKLYCQWVEKDIND